MDSGAMGEGGGPIGRIGPGDRIVLLQMGGLGDLVLTGEVLLALAAAGHRERTTLVCRADFAAVADLLPAPPARAIGLAFDPHRWHEPSEPLGAALKPVAAALAGLAADVLIDAGHRPLWFAPFVAALCRPRAAVSCHVATEPQREALARILLRDFGLAWHPIHRIAVPPRLRERERYRHLLGAFAIEPVPAPRWSVAAAPRERARAFLRESGLEPGGFVACFPGGNEAARLKRWPEANFAAALRAAGRPAVLIGSAEEAGVLARVAAALGGTPNAIFAGAPADLATVAALLAESRAWLGNDSGLMHLAQAHEVPGVGIFGGGGRWPSYAPWAPGAAGIVHPLPCFGCDWDCMLGHALCVESIPVTAVAAALRSALDGQRTAPAIVALDETPAGTREMLDDASRSYRAVQRDREERLETVLRGELAYREQSAARAMFETAAHERLASLDEAARIAGQHMAEIASLRERLALRDRELGKAKARLAAPGRVHAFQIGLGLGAGNIGDELMAQSFWSRLPDAIALDVALFPESARCREPYPARHRYLPVDEGGNENADAMMPGLLVGGTPVTDAEGVHWPLRFLAPRLDHFHRHRLPVDAVGVGVEPLQTEDGRALFRAAFGPIRSWTVRSEACRAALLDLGIEPARIRVGADWAWLYAPRRDRRRWAEETWRRLGIDPARPLLVANVVNMLWRDSDAAKRAIADAIARAAALEGLQVGFLGNECRDGEFFDHAAARDMAARLGIAAAVVPNAYFSPDEAVALLRHASVTLGQRYHFAIQSVLAGSVPVCIPRGAKIRDLAGELGIACIGSAASVDSDALLAAIRRAVEHGAAERARLALRQRALGQRAAGNMSFLEELPPYRDCWPACE